ncbi:MAG: MFS transporter [Deltaproteobacteria bacterium]|nr:MFS transporter [Deltaproteobacteria bacterium]
MTRFLTPYLILVIASMLSRFSYQMARSPVLPRFAQDLGSSPELIGLIVAASTITGIFVKLPAGALSDILGRRRILLLGAVFFAVPPFLYPLITGPVSLLLLRFLHGFATAIFSPVASAYVADLFQRGRGEKLGWFASATDVGATLGPLIGGFILFSTASYAVTYLVVGGLGILPLFMVLSLPPEEKKVLVPATANLGRWPQFTWRLTEFNRGVLEVVSSRAVIIASALEAAMYVGYGAFFLSLLLLSSLYGLGVAIVTPSTTALVADLARAGREGSAMGVFGTIWDSGEASGPILAGFLVASISYFNGFLVISGLMALAAVIFAATIKDPVQPSARQAEG